MSGTGLDHQKVEQLLTELSRMPVPGSSRGGPFSAVVHNELTQQILSYGEDVVPLLVKQLPGCGYNEAVYIVFLLRELGASQARPSVLDLQADVEGRSVGHDMTLRMQIEYFLRDH